MKELFVIEARDKNGQLLPYTYPQPSDDKAFGIKAITGISIDQMAKVIYRLRPGVVLSGMEILGWVRKIDSQWSVRRKTW